MAVKHIEFGQKMREKILAGVEKLAGAVKVTLGPSGRNVLIEQAFGAPRITKDGVTVAKQIELADKDENLAVQLVKDVASKTADIAGDGTTTATVLAEAILKAAFQGSASGMNRMEIKDGIDHGVKLVVEQLKKIATPVSGNREMIEQVATISANGDVEIGQMIAQAMEKVGREGVITVEEAKSFETELDIVEGMQIDKGYVSPYFVTNPEKMTTEFDQPYILLHESKINSVQPLIPILEAVSQSGRGLVIIAEDIEGDALALLVLNKLRAGLKVAAVKAPGFGDRRKAILGDIAVLTGGQVVSQEVGMKLENVKLTDLGRAHRVKITRDNTMITNAGDRDLEGAVKHRCEQIRAQIAETTSDYEREKLEERLAKLSGGVAVIRVGGATEAEVKERKDRVDDAVQATKAAVEEGIVPGGGIALLRCVSVLDSHLAASLKDKGHAFRYGVESLKKALQSPCRQIAENAGQEGGVVVERILEKEQPTWGYDARSNKYGDMIAAGVLDPVKVVRVALQNAASIAGLLTSSEVSITSVPEKDKGMGGGGMPGGMGGGMDF